MIRTVLITGGTGGLGTTVVQRLSQSYRCVVLYRREQEWDRLRAETSNVFGIQADVSDESSVNAAMSRAVSEHGRIYGLVHLIGGFEPGRIAESSVQTWNRMLELNVTAAFLTAKAAAPNLEDGGRIVVISSSASLKPVAGIGAYIVSKAALNALVDVLAIELKDRRITVNAILPSALDTPAMRDQMDRSKLVPLERVAETILYLLSDSAANATSSRIVLTA